jgi:DNA-binding transcriptional LysR family regulator
MVDVRRLKVLREVARHGSFSAAAGALGYTQPAISRQIAVLEGEMGTQLLLRTPHGVVLTDAGRMLVERGEDVLARLQRLEDEVRARADLAGGRLRLAVFASAAASIVPRALVRFRQRHPAVELSVIVADPGESLPLLRSGELDLALCHDGGEGGGESPRLECVPLLDDPMYVALPADHPLAGVSGLELSALANETWMLPTLLGERCPDAQLVLVACHAAGFEPAVAFEYDDYAALLGFVAAGVGLAPIPDMVARGVRDDVVLRHVDPPLPARPVVAALPAGYRSPAAAAMLDVLHEVVAEWEAEAPAVEGSLASI